MNGSRMVLAGFAAFAIGWSIAAVVIHLVVIHGGP